MELDDGISQLEREYYHQSYVSLRNMSSPPPKTKAKAEVRPYKRFGPMKMKNCSEKSEDTRKNKKKDERQCLIFKKVIDFDDSMLETCHFKERRLKYE